MTVGEAEDTLIVLVVNLLIRILEARLDFVIAAEGPPKQ